MVPGTVSQTLSSKSTMPAGSHCSSLARASSRAGWWGGSGGFSCSVNYSYQLDVTDPDPMSILTCLSQGMEDISSCSCP